MSKTTPIFLALIAKMRELNYLPIRNKEKPITVRLHVSSSPYMPTASKINGGGSGGSLSIRRLVPQWPGRWMQLPIAARRRVGYARRRRGCVGRCETGLRAAEADKLLRPNRLVQAGIVPDLANSHRRLATPEAMITVAEAAKGWIRWSRAAAAVDVGRR
jgi:hypothetical protein